MKCCDLNHSKEDHSTCPSCGHEAVLPHMSVSRWLIGFIAAMLMIYFFAKIL